MKREKVIVLGADGYLGWATCMRLASRGDDVIAVDNYSKRVIAQETGVKCLVEPRTMQVKAILWNQVARVEGEGAILAVKGDVSDYEFISKLLIDHQPDTIIHYAEQPSGPYSLRGQKEGQFTVTNNVIGTHNLLWAMLEHCRDVHLIKLGTMGEYGTPNIDIPEGWLEIDKNGRKDKLLFPRAAGSLYHTCKVLETDLIWFFVRMFNLRVSDIMQGPVYGIYTNEIRRMDLLEPPFWYDDIFGTVVNRFVVQAVAELPLTVYGKGMQTRGYINIEDVVQAIDLVSQNPADKGELSIYNQITESLSVNDIAGRVLDAARAMGYDGGVTSLDNPRKEAEEHYYNVEHKKLTELGLVPHLMSQYVLTEMLQYVEKWKSNINREIVYPSITWYK